MNNLVREETANGAMIIANTKDKVLCIFNGEYVMWSYADHNRDSNGNLYVYWGHYFNNDIIAAMNAWRDVVIEELS